MYRVPMSDVPPAPMMVRARVSAADVAAALRQISELLATVPGTTTTAEDIAKGLLARESVAPTNIGSGIAMPHFIDHRMTSASMVLITLSSPITWGSVAEPVDIAFGLTGTPSEPWRHVRSLARLARICAIPGFADRLRGAADDESLRRAFAAEAGRHE